MDKVKAREDLNEEFKAIMQLSQKSDSLRYAEETLIKMLDDYKNYYEGRKMNDFTHYLNCRHCVGRNCIDYRMQCVLLKITKSGKAKVLVFGNRDWSYDRDMQKVRYVNPDRLTKRN